MNQGTHPYHIVIVEDEPELGEILQQYLHQAGMRCRLLADGSNALETIHAEQPDLVILDVMLPGVDGLSLCKELCRTTSIPVILESARVEELDRLLGLELGADDYICKPWSPREVVARVKAVLRRTELLRNPARPAQPDDRLRLDAGNWGAVLDDTALNLTRKEFQLLATMQQRPGQVHSRAQLIKLAFHDDNSVFERTIDSHVKNIRRKFKLINKDFVGIRSVYGVGYVYEPDQQRLTQQPGHG